MEFRILGPLEVVSEDGLVALPRGRGRALLALLLIHAGEVLSTDRIIDELWGSESPPTARDKLYVLVSDLRKRLSAADTEPEERRLIETSPPGYVLEPNGARVDAHRFRQLVAEAIESPAVARAERLRQALGMWRGPALVDFTYQPFAQQEIAALEELRLAATEERIGADLILGRHGDLVAELEGLVEAHPYRERLRGQLMLALYRNGRQAEALNTYNRARVTLMEELGIEPGPDLQELEQRVLLQDPSLDLAPTATPSGRGSVGKDVRGQKPWISEGRKPVTVVFSEITASVTGGAEPEPEMVRRIVGRAYESASRVLTRHGGTVEGLIGGTVVAIFGVPVAHEDDALRAARATVELGRAIDALNEELETGRVSVRTGLETGEVVVGGVATGRTAASGDPIQMAGHLQQAATEGEILIGEGTRRLIGYTAELRREQRPWRGETLESWKLLALDADDRSAHLDTPMVGRARELERLRDCYQRIGSERVAGLVTIIGEAGVGKSRLVMDFVDSLRDESRVLTGHCPSYGDGIAFWPLREVVLEAAGRPEPDAVAGLFAADAHPETAIAQVTGAIGLAEDPGTPAELFPAFRVLFESLARSQVVVVVLEDVHWAESTFLDLVEYLAHSAQAPLLLVCTARPEILPQRRRWVSDVTIDLGPLDPEQSRELLALRPGAELSEETIRSLIDLARGNPLFLEQLQASLRDEHTVAIPPSVHALLAARLDRLGPAERDLLRCASVVGEVFPVRALSALVPDEARPFFDRYLDTLVERELLRPTDRSDGGGPGFAFRHALIQMAAYRSLTRAERARLHEDHAVWLAEAMGHRALEFEELIGHHLEQAWQQWTLIGLADQHVIGLAERAGTKLARAGIRAFARMDVPGAVNLLARARELLPAEHRLMSDVARHLPEAHEMMGQHAEADSVLTETLERLVGDETHRRRQIRLERARIRLLLGPDPTPLEVVNGVAEEALEAFLESGDHAGVSQATIVLGLVHLRRGEPRKMEEIARLGLEHAELSAYHREILASRWWVVLALTNGPTSVVECIETCEELVRVGGGFHVGILAELALLRTMLGELGEGRRLIDRARKLLVERIRAPRPLMFVTVLSGAVESLAGELDEARTELQAALDMAVGMDESEVISQVAGQLSRLLPMGSDEARRMAALSAERAPAEDIRSKTIARSAQARVLAGQGESGPAERLARDAVDLVGAEMLNLRAERQMDLADVLLAIGKHEAAAPVIAEAIDLYNRKGNLIAADRAAALLG